MTGKTVVDFAAEQTRHRSLRKSETSGVVGRERSGDFKHRRGPAIPLLLDGDVPVNALIVALEASGYTLFYDDIARAVVITVRPP